jgi:hypothetical protein
MERLKGGDGGYLKIGEGCRKNNGKIGGGGGRMERLKRGYGRLDRLEGERRRKGSGGNGRRK